VSEWEQLDDPELKRILRKYMIQGGFFLLAFALTIFLLALAFETQINTFATWLTETFGVFGLMAMVFFTDTFISPIPPDATLFLVGRGPLHDDWWFLVPLLGFSSMLAGLAGWWIGRRLKNIKYFRRMVNYFGSEHQQSAKKFGFWVVVIGALTPVPFSLTCWFAGIFKMPFKSIVIAASFRIPRFVLYYWAIFYSGEIGSFLRSLTGF